MNRYDYVKYDEQAAKEQAEAKELFAHLTNFVERRLRPGRAKSLVLTKLEEAYMWIGKQIRDDQIERNGGPPLQEERTNG